MKLDLIGLVQASPTSTTCSVINLGADRWRGEASASVGRLGSCPVAARRIALPM
jgi:hypothetical protein